MIALLTGVVRDKRPGAAIIDVGGVGYELAMSTASLAALPAEGDEVVVYTRLQVREDQMSLFGFENEEERDLFDMLIGVSGVGPKVALSALSALAPKVMKEAIARGDDALISSTPGIGKKTAQRIIVELKDKLEVPDLAAKPAQVSADTFAEATEALVSMGFSRSEAASALGEWAGAPEPGAEDLVRFGLRHLGRAK